jgi:hypothetical protein
MTAIPMAWIRLRCKADEDTGCLIWQQCVNQSGAPVVTMRTEDGRKPTFQVRRKVWESRHGHIPAGMVVACTCKNSRCLTCLELVTKAEIIRRQWKKPDARAKLTAGATRASRERAKLDADKVRDIRHSNETLEVVAARCGISVSLASAVRRGVRWKERSPFDGLGRQA